MSQRFHLGRLPRGRDSRVPHLSALTAGLGLPDPPASANWLSELPANLGAMLNDRYGCCTIAAIGHARQLWTFHAQGRMGTIPNPDILAMYEQWCGFNPNDPASDRGGVEQTVLKDWMTLGAILANGRDHLAAFVEVDSQNEEDVARTISEGGCAYVGLQIPQWFVDELDNGTLPMVWDVAPTLNNDIVDGHAVVLGSYGPNSPYGLISWGNPAYSMTPAFAQQFMDEAYWLADRSWVEKTGKTPAGLSLPQLELMMSAIKGT